MKSSGASFSSMISSSMQLNVAPARRGRVSKQVQSPGVFVSSLYASSMTRHEIDQLPLSFNEVFREIEALNIDDDDLCIRRVEKTLIQDNKDDFVQLINSLPCDFPEDELDLIEFYMFMWDSGNCAAAVLAGEAKISNVTACLAVGSNPLHEAAIYGACKITALLLERGFSADVRCDYGSQNLRDVLPLGVALSQLRRDLSRNNFKGRTSAVNCVIGLCGQRRRLETLRLLALNSREVKREFFNYLNEGKMIEVGALLLVARSRLLSSSTAKGEFRSISEMRDFVLDDKSALSAGASLAERKKLIEMEETLVLLKIFDRVGDKLATLIRLDPRQLCLTYYPTLAAASLIEDAGFDVKAEYVYYNHSYTRGSAIEFESNVLEKGVDECKKAAVTTNVLPSWVKEAALSGLADKSGSTSRLRYPVSLEALPEINSVSVSAMTSGLAFSKLENMSLHHLLKKGAPFLKRVVRR